MSALSKILKLSRTADPEEEALERLRRSVRQDPRSLQFVPLADLCRKRLLFDEAIDACHQGLSHHPTYVSGFLALARAYQEAGDLAHAIAAYHRVVELAPQNLVGHMCLADLYEQGGQLELARAHLVFALDLGHNGAELTYRIERIDRVLGGGDEGDRDTASYAAPPVGRPTRPDELLLREKIAALEAYRDRFTTAPL